MALSRFGIIFAAVLFFASARAANRCADFFEFRFGPEFTVTSQEIVDEGNRNPTLASLERSPLKARAWRELVHRIQAKCQASGECVTSMTRDKHARALLISFANSYYITVGIDVSVIEANAAPRTRSSFHQNTEKVQQYFFDTAREMGLRPHERAGNGHIHISREAFREHGEVLRNFFVDFQNRPELIFGALGNHLLNSPPLAALKSEQRDALETVLRDLDSKPAAALTIERFVTVIEEQVYTHTFYAELDDPTYYQAFNMTRLKNKRNATLEIRSFRPQESARIYELQTKLLDTWIRRMESLEQSIPYVRKDRHEFTPGEMVASFRDLVRQLDLDWSEFKILLPENLREIQPDPSYRSAV